MKNVESVNNLIKREIGDILLKKIDIGREIITTVTRVKTASNFIQTKVFISVIPENQLERVMGILGRNIYDIQQILNKRIKMRPIPKIVFVKEDSVREADNVEKIIERLKKD